MNLAAIDWVWLIIAIIVILGKLWNKFVEMQSQEKEPPPAAAPPPVRRQARPQPRPPAASSPVRPAREEGRQAPPEDLREFMERLTRPPQPKQVAPPPAMARPVPPPPPVPKPVEPVAPPPAPTRPSRRASQWTEALRDRQNLRNIIISAEIIGPPRGA